MKNIFLAPHNDDESLFGSYIIQRTHAWIYVCMDGNQHEAKFNLPIQTRRQESEGAAHALRTGVSFLGLSDIDVTEDQLYKELYTIDAMEHPGFVFAPAKMGGNAQHDMVSTVAKEVFQNVLYYSTYAKNSLVPVGEMALFPTDMEREAKERALSFYVSQLKINGHHFAAVENKPEYLSFSP